MDTQLSAMSTTSWTVLISMLAFTAIVSFFAKRHQKRRTTALFDIALRMGFGFDQKVPAEWLTTLGPFRLFKLGHSHSGKNMMRGKSGDADLIVLDYQYVTGGGRNNEIHVQTVAIFSRVAAAVLPNFTLAPLGWADKIGKVFGEQDIGFEANEEFSKHYLLQGPDEAAIRAAFGVEALGFFAQHQGLSVESAGEGLLVYRGEQRCEPEEFEAFLAGAAAVRDALAAPQTAPTPQTPDQQTAASVARQGRRDWIDNVRDILADFDAHLQAVGQRVASGQSPAGEDLKDLDFFVVKLKLVLNPQDEGHTRLLAAAGKALAESHNLTKDSAATFAAAGLELMEQGQLVLKKEWDAISSH